MDAREAREKRMKFVDAPRNADWSIAFDGKGYAPDQVTIALLMDIRGWLQAVRSEMAILNRVIHCPHFLGIPDSLRAITKNTAPKKKKKAKN